MWKDDGKVLVVALTAVLLTLIVLLFVAANPWMLAGVAAVLFAIAAIIRAINGDRADDSSTVEGDETPPLPEAAFVEGGRRRRLGPRTAVTPRRSRRARHTRGMR